MTQIYDLNPAESTINQPHGNISVIDLHSQKKISKESLPKSTKTSKENLFPLEVFPEPLIKLIKEASIAYGYHEDYTATGILFAASAAIGATHKLELKKGKLEHAVLFTIVVGNPNSNKSSAFAFGSKPILAEDSKKYAKYREEFKNYLDSKDSDNNNPPTPEKSMVQDSTKEALARNLYQNPRGLGLIRDEAIGFLNDINRYNGKGNEGFYLSIWTGGFINVERVSSAPLRVESPFLSIGGTIQPGVLKEIPKAVGSKNGFIDRFLFAWPESEKPLWKLDEVNKGLIEKYDEVILRLLELDFRQDELGEGWIENKPNVVKLSDAAREKLFHYFNEVNKPICDNEKNELLAGIHGKFDLHVSRLALILQLIWHAYGEGGKDSISTATIEKAITLGEYFRANAIKVHNRIYDKTAEVSAFDLLPDDHKAVYKKLPEQFNTKDGIGIAKKAGFSRSWFMKWKNDTELFCKEKNGVYSKNF